MKLTWKKVMDAGAEVSANRNREFLKMAEGESDTTQMLFVTIMTNTHAATTVAINKRLGITDDNTEVEVSKSQFIEAQADSISDMSNMCQGSFDLQIEVMMFGNLLTREIFDKGDENK